MLIRSLFRLPTLKTALAFVVAQQLLVAAGTLLLARLAVEVQAGALSFVTCAALLVCVALPGTVGHYAVSRFTVLAIKDALRAYYLSYVSANYGRAAQWRSGAGRHEVVCKTGPDAVQSATIFLVDVAATSLNIVLNTVSVMLVTSMAMGAAIGIAGVAGLCLVYLAGSRISRASRNEMATEAELTGHLQRSWDNVVLGNRVFFERWLTRFERKFSDTRAGALRATFDRDGVVAAAALFTNVIVMGTALAIAYFHRSEPALVLALVVTLPRSLQIVMHIQVVQGYWAQWKSLVEKLGMAEEGMREPASVELGSFIRPELISVERDGLVTPLAQLSVAGTGRVTITGANGAGKSTALLALKARAGEGAVYLPSHHQLERVEEGGSLSSGEGAISALRCAAQSGAKILLLDEWDANLSPDNRAIQHALIEELSRVLLVVEVRHAREGA